MDAIWVAKDPTFLHVENLDSDQTVRMHRLIYTLAVRTCQVVPYAGYRRRNSYTMVGPPVRGDNPRALASGLSLVQVDKHGITILYHPHQCRPCTS